MSSNPITANKLHCPGDGAALNLDIAFGPCDDQKSGTGFYGDQDGIHLLIEGVEQLQFTTDGILGPSAPFSGDSSFQPIAVDLEITPTAGADLPDTAFLAPVMGNLLGTDSDLTGNYLAGVIGAMSLSGSISTHLQSAALLGIVMDGSTEAKAVVMAVIDGSDPSAITRADSAFAVQMNNSNAGSGVDWGLNLYSPAHDGTLALPIAMGEVRFSNGTKITVSGDTIVFTNLAGDKSVTLTMT